MSASGRQRHGLLTFVIVASAMFLLAYSAGLLLRPSETYLRLQSNLIYNIPAAAGLALALVAIRRSSGKQRSGFVALGLVLLCWQVADWAFSYYDLVLDRDSPAIGPADAFYYAGYVAFVAAIALLAFPERPRRDRRWLIDAAMIVAVAGAISWQYILGPIVAQGEQTPFAAAVALGYPVLDLALLGALIAALHAGGPHSSPRIFVLGLACLVQVITDGIYTYLVNTTGYDNTGNPLELGWLVAYALILVCFALPAESRRHDERVTQSLFGLLLPYAAVLPVGVLAVTGVALGEASTALVVGSAVAALLVLARQLL